MPFRFALGRGTSPKLRILQLCQLSITACTIVAVFLTAVIPSRHKGFTFGLLYSSILTSCTTTFLVHKELRRAAQGTLTKDKYIKYQLLKIFAALGLSVVAFVASAATPKGPVDVKKPGDQGLWIGGIKVNKWQGMILWLVFFNWVFLWASLSYSCCMTDNKQGQIALTGDEAQIEILVEDAEEEAIDAHL